MKTGLFACLLAANAHALPGHQPSSYLNLTSYPTSVGHAVAYLEETLRFTTILLASLFFIKTRSPSMTQHMGSSQTRAQQPTKLLLLLFPTNSHRPPRRAHQATRTRPTRSGPDPHGQELICNQRCPACCQHHDHPRRAGARGRRRRDDLNSLGARSRRIHGRARPAQRAFRLLHRLPTQHH